MRTPTLLSLAIVVSVHGNIACKSKDAPPAKTSAKPDAVEAEAKPIDSPDPGEQAAGKVPEKPVARPAPEPPVPEGFDASTVGTAQVEGEDVTLLIRGHRFASLQKGRCRTPRGAREEEKDDVFAWEEELEQTWWRFEGDRDAYVQFVGEQVLGWTHDPAKECWRRGKLTPDRYPGYASGRSIAESGPVTVGERRLDVEVEPTRVTIEADGRKVSVHEPEEFEARCAYYRSGARGDLVDFEVTFTDMAPLSSPTDCTDVNVQVETQRVRIDVSESPPEVVPPPAVAPGNDYQGVAVMGDGVLKWGGKSKVESLKFPADDPFEARCIAENGATHETLEPRFRSRYFSAEWKFLVDGEVLASASSSTKRREKECVCLDCGE